jgi:hypothetical protein
MSTCDDYQLGYEMQLHGATPSISIEDITAHVASCESCIAYVAATNKAETMNTSTWLHHEPINTDLIRARMKKELARQRLHMWSWLPQLAIVTAFLAWHGTSPTEVAAVMAAIIVGLGINLRLYFTRRGAVGLTDGDLIAIRRAQLDRRLARTRGLWFTLLIPLFFVLPPALSRGGEGIEKMMQPVFFISTGGIYLIALVMLLQRRSDQRERRALGE